MVFYWFSYFLFYLDILRNLYLTLIYPYYNYCLLAWGSACKSILLPLKILQKKQVRILTQSEYYAHTSLLFKELKLLKLDDIYSLHTHILMYKCLILDRYPSMRDSIINVQMNHRYDTRSNELRLPFCRTNKSKQRVLYQGIKNWNSLPQELKESLSLNSLKRNCKSYFINMY